MPRLRLVLAAALAALALIAVAAASARSSADPTPQEAIASLNALRAANGIPGPVAFNQAWSDECKLHNHYMKLNGMMHDEDPQQPGYTAAGNDCGSHAVLAGDYGWGPAETPWDNAPIHLDQMLSPLLKSSGAYVSEGFSSLTTWLGYDFDNVGPADVLYPYPNDGKPVPYAQLAAESPFTPQKFVGIPESKTTGPYLYVFADGPFIAGYQSPHVTAVSLTGPKGAVAVKTVDSQTPTLGAYLSPSAMIIPVDPLEPGTTYQAAVTLQTDSGQASASWSFTTMLRENAGRLEVYPGPPHLAMVFARAAAPGRLTVKLGAKVVMTRRTPLVARLKLPRKGLYLFCLDSGGGQTGYQAFHSCLRRRIR